MWHRNKEMVREIVHIVLEFKHESKIKKDRNAIKLEIN